ncbi:endochitinase [Coemansia spiralis]|nr:endochitinase [Coemansia spiralis]
MRLTQLVPCAIAFASLGVSTTDVVFGYLPTWQASKADSIDFSKYTHITIAFAVPDESGHLSMDQGDSVLKEWVPRLSEAKAKVLVSLGGWTGSKYLSPIMSDKSKRDQMISNMVQWMQDYGFDGWDVDFEYPGRQGNTCHPFDAQKDTPNFLQFLRDLRQRLDSEFGTQDTRKLITLATRFQPFDGPQGPLADVSDFDSFVDYFNLMLYDFNGVWSDTTGPNAPLDHAPGKGLQFSARSSVQSWIDAGIPASKINAGLAFYGRTVTADSSLPGEAADNMYWPLRKAIPRGDGDDKEEADPSCGGPKAFSGIWKYSNMRTEGVLDFPDAAAAPWVRRFDKTTFTPWLFNTETKDFVSYDDPESIAAKTRFAIEKGLAGVMVWPATNDYQDELISAITSAMSS